MSRAMRPAQAEYKSGMIASMRPKAMSTIVIERRAWGRANAPFGRVAEWLYRGESAYGDK